MQLQTILNTIEKQKGFVYESIRWNDQKPALLVSIRPHGRSRPICSRCGRKGSGYDTLAERRFEFVPLWAIPVFFLYSRRRVDCRRCGVTVEKVPWSDGKHRTTFSYRVFLSRWAKRLRAHRQYLLNWFIARGEISNGIVEALHSKAKLTMKKGYGFKSDAAIQTALYHQLGRLPEPETTHRF